MSPKNSIRFDSLTQEAYLNLWRTYDCLKGLEDELFGKYDLSAQQYNALRILKSIHPRPFQTSMLGRRLISRSPDMTRMLDRLEKRGLVIRTRNPGNRRVVEVSITDNGLELLNELSSAVFDLHEKQLGHLGQDELLQFINQLKIVRKPLEDDSCDWLDKATEIQAIDINPTEPSSDPATNY
jgi:DNA-binding MarR family transcriptional regulator